MTLTYQTPNTLRGELAARWPEWSDGDARRAIALRKKTIYQGNHLGLVVNQIKQKMPDPDLHKDVVVFASRSPNLLKAVTDAVAVVYGRGCRRALRGLSEKAAKAFASLVDESQISKRSVGINALSWVAGPVTLAPLIDKRKRLALDIITPDTVELRRTGDSIDAALWQFGSGFVELDEEAYRYYDEGGRLYQTIPIGRYPGQPRFECPAVPFISMDNSGGDFWTSGQTQGLADNTLNIAYKLAYSLYLRQVSGNKLTVINGEIEKIPPGQSVGELAGALHLNGRKSEVDIKVLDRVVSARDGLEEIAAIMAMTVSEFGIPPGTVGMTANSNFDQGTLAISVEGDRLGALRDKQVPWLLASEREFWPLVCDFVKGSDHRLAKVIPGGDEIRDALRISYPDLASAKDQIARIEALKAALPLGIGNPRDYLAASRPERTEDEIEEEMHENLETYINVIVPLVERNIPKEAPAANGMQTISQEQGREGGQASGDSRAVVANAA